MLMLFISSMYLPRSLSKAGMCPLYSGCHGCVYLLKHTSSSAISAISSFLQNLGSREPERGLGVEGAGRWLRKASGSSRRCPFTSLRNGEREMSLSIKLAHLWSLHSCQESADILKGQRANSFTGVHQGSKLRLLHSISITI